MTHFLKWLGMILGAIAALASCAALYLFFASQHVIARSYDVPLGTFDAPNDQAAVQRGERLATIYGCNNCHGADLSGTDLFNEPGVAHITAPNLTEVVKDYTDAELERLIRHGIKHDGRSAWIMPAVMFNRLSDADLGDITAYVRSFPQRPGIERRTDVGVVGRVGILTGQFKPQAVQVQALPTITMSADDALSKGRYLVMTSCTECHGTRLQGSEYMKSPNLAIVAAYPEPAFAKLMREGVGLGDRQLGLMTQVARARFSHFNAAEVEAIRGYLDAYARGSGELP